ncbi:hypothetical protein BCON_0344g00110 [Botryotinia convoluta]|uniref:Uncharacterized protein n=1 Tax=Botryotinia convoluta TaxID=54673 RepID=A0A4Z1HBA1_9HELO|nr:hypothetical protein BCON_0344g00110 [Botryotinia convoluta]
MVTLSAYLRSTTTTERDTLHNILSYSQNYDHSNTKDTSDERSKRLVARLATRYLRTSITQENTGIQHYNG